MAQSRILVLACERRIAILKQGIGHTSKQYTKDNHEPLNRLDPLTNMRISNKLEKAEYETLIRIQYPQAKYLHQDRKLGHVSTQSRGATSNLIKVIND